MKKHSVLHVGFSQPPLERAFANSFKHYDFIQWTDYQKKVLELRSVITTHLRTNDYDLLFFQLQTADVITPEFCQLMKDIQPQMKIVNWTGDVRYPLPRWYVEIGRHIDITLFSNKTDVNTAISEGIKADYLQIGFDDSIFKPVGEIEEAPAIVFMGNNYPKTFPLSDLRFNMVHHLHKRYGKLFGVYGGNWSNVATGNLMGKEVREAATYRGCKIALNVSHFDYDFYSSDRIFRIMGSGAFCLSKFYPGIEYEFIPGVDLGIWHGNIDFNDLDSKIDYYLENNDERKKIAETGSKKVHTQYTWNKRIITLRKIINLE